MSQTKISMCRKYIQPWLPTGIIKEREILHWNSSDLENEPTTFGKEPPGKQGQPGVELHYPWGRLSSTQLTYDWPCLSERDGHGGGGNHRHREQQTVSSRQLTEAQENFQAEPQSQGAQESAQGSEQSWPMVTKATGQGTKIQEHGNEHSHSLHDVTHPVSHKEEQLTTPSYW